MLLRMNRNPGLMNLPQQVPCHQAASPAPKAMFEPFHEKLGAKDGQHRKQGYLLSYRIRVWTLTQHAGRQCLSVAIKSLTLSRWLYFG